MQHHGSFDGARKGKTNDAGAGWVLDGHGHHRYLGNTVTSNQAEYMALIALLKQAIQQGINTLHVKGDSQLIVQQVVGGYQCRHYKLIPLLQQVRDLEKELLVTYEWVPRKENQAADFEANRAIEQKSMVPI